MTGHAKTGHVGTKYTLWLNESYLVTGIKYFVSVTCIAKPDKLGANCKNFIAIEYRNRTEETLDKWSNFVCQHDLFSQAQSHNICCVKCTKIVDIPKFGLIRKLS